MPSPGPRTRRLSLVVCALALLSGAASIGCAGYMPTPPLPPALDGFAMRNLDRVDEGVYRGSQPSSGDLAALISRYGIRTVLKLNRGSDLGGGLPRVQFIVEQLDPLVTPSHERLLRILEEIEAAQKPIFIHCTHGEDRTGLVVALYRMRHGLSAEQAYADMVRHGFHPYTGVWNAWLRESGWDHPPTAITAQREAAGPP